MNEKKGVLLAMAVSGLMLAAVGCSSADQKTDSSGSVAMGECHGVNSCKGTTECAGKSNSCSGKNSCKGQGWKKLSQADCTSQGGEFKTHAM